MSLITIAKRLLVLAALPLVLLGCQASLDDPLARSQHGHEQAELPPLAAKQTPLASVSLCADAYLIALAPDEIGARITGLSWQAGSALSTLPDTAPPLEPLRNSRELLFGLTATPILGPGEVSARSDAITLEWGEDFETVRRNLARLGAETGLNSDEVAAQIDALNDLPSPRTAPKLLYLSRSGGSAGPGTFVDAAITKAGGVNLNTTPGWHTPTLERILAFEPDIILTSFFDSDYAGVSDRAVRHGALRRFIAARPRIDIAGKLWPCACPGLITATEQINAGILAWDRKTMQTPNPT